MNRVTICRGLPASGKSSWTAEQLETAVNTVAVSKDYIRAMMFANSKRKPWHEGLVLKVRDAIIDQALKDKRNIIIDDTNLNPIHEKNIRELIDKGKYPDRVEVTIQEFDKPLEDCIKDDLKREKSVGETVIRDMHNQYIRPKLKVEQDPENEDAVIFDLDGNLALIGDRSPYDATECEYDKLNQPVYDCLHRYQDGGYKIIICSGRSSKYLKQTDRWLGKHGIKPDLFLMRKEGDIRRDSILKREMFIKYILPKYYVNVVYDDRQQVVDMWRDLGLTVFQTADGRF